MGFGSPGFIPTSFAAMPPSMSMATTQQGELKAPTVDRDIQMKTEESTTHVQKDAFGPGTKKTYTKDPKSLLPLESQLRLSSLEPMFASYSTPSTWTQPDLRPVPTYYPMERSNCILKLSEHSVEDITQNISDCLRKLSVQANYFNKPAAAALLTPEHVEIYLALWKTPNDEIQVELQRRKGDSVTFHRYCRHILDASSGDFDATEVRTTGSLHYLKAAEKLLRSELSKTNADDDSKAAMELTHSLLTKDRMDARKLGMESLCILTDPSKTHLPITIMASRAVLLGGESIGNDIHTLILNLVQKRCMGDEEKLLEGMPVEYDSDDEDFFPSDDERDNTRPPEYNDTMSIMLNHALIILANSWQVVSTFESFDGTPETTLALPSLELLIDNFLHDAMEVTDTDMVFSLLQQMQRAPIKPHNACLATKTLTILVTHSTQARDRAIKIGAAQVVARAFDVGVASHAKLEQECRSLLEVLNSKH